MKIPASIKIRGNTWKIIRRWGITMDGKKCDGLCSLDTKTIILEQGLTRGEVQAVFLHELNHAILHELHVQTIEIGVEEILVEGFTQVYLDLFKLRWRD